MARRAQLRLVRPGPPRGGGRELPAAPDPGGTGGGLSRDTAFEAGPERLIVEVAADEDQARVALVRRLPGALEVALEDHVHGLEHQAALLALDVEDALGT